MKSRQHILPGWLAGLTSLVILLAGGCDRDLPHPVYLRLRQPRIALDSTGTRTTTLGIKDLWIDHNGTQLGVFRVPSVIPLLPSEVNRMTFSGGVFETGLSSFRARYPFWQPVSFNVSAEALDTVDVDLTYFYYPDSVLHFPFNETFEEASIAFESVRTGATVTELEPTADDWFEGRYCGRAVFSQDRYEFEVIGRRFLDLPQRGNNDIYLEITYKSNIPFTAGLYYRATAGSDVGELPANIYFESADSWNTVYVHVNDAVRGLNDALFKPYLRANAKDPDTGTIKNGFLQVDNVRIVHFAE
ncbi:MAG: hypothetical protein SF053_17575 [Bacteroidia bacterium]|nr:hypothetical protein [Bacteroidia bacterium]